MKNGFYLVMISFLLSACGGPPSVDALVENEELREKVAGECLTMMGEGKWPDEEEKCVNAMKAQDIVDKSK